MKYIAYYKRTRTPSIARQEKLLAEYDIWHAVENDVDAAIQMLRKGRVLVVAHIGLLGRAGSELRDITRRVHAVPSYIIEASTGRKSCDPEDAFSMGLDAMKRKTLTREAAKKIATQYDDQMFIDALPRWYSDETREDIAKDLGVSLSTFVRRMRDAGAKKRV